MDYIFKAQACYIYRRFYDYTTNSTKRKKNTQDSTILHLDILLKEYRWKWT